MPSSRPRIYVAGKYSDPTPEGRLANTRRAMEVGLQLWHKGYAPFIPHLSHFTDELAAELGSRLDYQDWIDWDDLYQEVCEVFFYDSSSKGADRELENARRLGQPIFRNVNDVPLASDLLRHLRPSEHCIGFNIPHPIQLELLIQRLPHAEGLPLPAYQSAGAAGLDLCAATPLGVDMALYPGETAMIPTGYAVAIPSGCAGLVLPRSGLATKCSVTLANTPGLVDSDFRGELMLALRNQSDRVFNFQRGARLAQFVLIDFNRAVWSVVTTLPETDRGEGGFGSTGLQN
jgi:dUTP pyrophosphatase